MLEDTYIGVDPDPDLLDAVKGACSVTHWESADFDWTGYAVSWAASVRGRWDEARAAQCHLLRCLSGNPFRPPQPVTPSVRTWHEATVVRLAQAAYEQRSLPQGTLDNARLAVLADTLEDAGYSDAELLGHLRGPGPHVQGCFAVDAVLSRE